MSALSHQSDEWLFLYYSNTDISQILPIQLYLRHILMNIHTKILSCSPFQCELKNHITEALHPVVVLIFTHYNKQPKRVTQP